ncbi:MAG: DUF4142 domain-containing protein, partial [Saprospiraceae bacterium]
LFLMSFFSFISCNGDQKVITTEASLVPGKPDVDLTKESDKKFIVSAYEFNWYQIMLSKLASRRTSSEEVRQFSAMLEDASRDTKTALGSLAIMKSIRISSDPTQVVNAAYDTLNLSTVEDFDIAYCNMIIQSHKDAIALFENATRDNLDPDIKSWASSVLPDLRAHLLNATACETHLNPMSELIR